VTDDSQPSWQQLLDLVTQLNEGNYDTVAVSYGDVSIRLSKSGVVEPEASVSVVPAPVAVAAPVPPVGVAPIASGAAITAPMLGVFYRRPSPGSAPFVEPGQTVEADTTIGIIEIMKLMNPVVAGAAGVISAFEVGDGESVQFGQTLARLESTAN
jgi:acetyl-CoA carboxylase biotin carboxyl carrier protein